MHYEHLAEELRWARSLGEWYDYGPPVQPTRAQRILVFKDRITAATMCTSADLRGRWFGLYDRARGLVPIWTGMLCALTFREMILRGIGVISQSAHDVMRSHSIKGSSLDKGVLKCAQGLLCSDEFRSQVFTWVATYGTFRARSGMRTANKMPPGFQNAPAPWRGHARVSWGQQCARAVGDWVWEINETLSSLRNGKFTVEPANYAKCNVEHSKNPTLNSLHVNPMEDAEVDGHSEMFGQPFVQPSKSLLRYISARTRSQGVHELGILKFASFVHPSLEVAQSHFLKYRDVLRKCTKAMDCTDEMTLHTQMKESLLRLFRDDIFNEACIAFGHMQSVKCARFNIDDECDDEPQNNDLAQDENAESTDSQHAWKLNRRHTEPSDPKQAQERKATEAEKRERGYKPKCTQPCMCTPAGNGLRRTILAMCTSIHGTKSIEDSFNSIRSARDSRSKKSRGKADNSMCTKYMAQHANTLRQERKCTSQPIKMCTMDFENDAQLHIASRKEALRRHFVNRQEERYKPAYDALRALVHTTRLSNANRQRCAMNSSFSSMKPKNVLGSHSVQLLVSSVHRDHWSKSWMCCMIPDGTILFNPEKKKSIE